MSVQPSAAPIAKPVPNQPAEANGSETDDAAEYGGRKFLFFCAAPGWLVSMVVHTFAVVAMALIDVDISSDKRVAEIVARTPDAIETLDEYPVDVFPELPVEQSEKVTVQPVSHIVTTQIAQVTEKIGVANDADVLQVAVELSDFSDRTAPRAHLLTTVGAVTGGGTSGRGTAAQNQLSAERGGTKGSQDAVASALQWLAAHQSSDGGWSFNHQHSPLCQGKCDHPGGLHQEGRMGATGLVLLPFLGHGDTHKAGKYKDVVGRGLYYLASNMKKDGAMSDSGGNMYAHGICSIALCEAYAMTHDKTLMAPAQACLNYIAYAQDLVGGGWRYGPGRNRPPANASTGKELRRI